MIDRFLAYRPHDYEGDVAANVMAASGTAARAAVAAAYSTGTLLDLEAPDSPGLHVWEGHYGVEGDWRRATADDLESFGLPLSEPVGDPDQPEAHPGGPGVDGFCCQMRRKFLPGIIVNDVSVPTPVDLADYVIRWHPKPIVFSMAFCPFCGRKADRSQVLRILE